MPQLILVFLAVAALRGLIEQTRRDLAAWRSRPHTSSNGLHTAGYWLHQAVHGFPTVRHGFMSGWHRGRTAHLHARRQMHRASTEHIEAQADAGPELASYRQRRQEAWERINRQREEEAARQAGYTYHYGPADRQWEVQATDENDAVHGASRAAWHDPGRRFHAVERPVAGGPDRVIREFEEAPPDPPDDPEPAPQQPEPEREPTPQPAGPPPQQQGEPMGDTTFPAVMARMDAAASSAEQRHAEAEQGTTATEEHATEASAAKAYAAVTADEMQALEVDAASLGAMADHLAAVDEAESAAQELHEQMGRSRDAWARVQETALGVKDRLLAGGHGALADAHADAAGGGAQKDFYTEG
jgi:hypothetical protein